MSGSVGNAPRSKKTLERESEGFKWCGPDGCGFPERPCRWHLCEEESRIEMVRDQESGRMVEVEMSCLARDHPHAHGTPEMYRAASSGPPGKGTSPSTNRVRPDLLLGMWVPEMHAPGCACPTGALRCAENDD